MFNSKFVDLVLAVGLINNWSGTVSYHAVFGHMKIERAGREEGEGERERERGALGRERNRGREV